MSDDPIWLVAGIIIGLFIGMSLGFIASQYFHSSSQVSSSVMFDRDERGNISGIHYVPQAIKLKKVD